MRKLHDVYSKQILQEALDPVDMVELEKPISSPDSQFADVFCVPRPKRPSLREVPYLGLCWKMTEQSCSFEPCSKTPAVSELRILARKQLSLHLQICKESQKKKVPMPLQWVISPGRPEAGLAALKATPAAGYPPGFYYSGEFLELWLVVLSELPETADTRLLRLLGREPMRQKARDEISALPEEDPSKRPWLEILKEMGYFFVRKNAVASKEEKDMTQLRQEFEQFKADLRREAAQQGKAEGIAEGKAEGIAEGKAEGIAEGKAEGIAEGKAEGIAEGKAEGIAEGKAAALLAVLAARGLVVNESVQEKILICQDQAILDRWLLQSVTATSADEIIAAAA